MAEKTETPWYLTNSPDLGRAYAHFRLTVAEKGVLDRKTKELLQVALACVLRCPHCVEDHIKGALDAGATKQEVTEALIVAAFEGAGTQLNWVKEKYEQYLGSR